MKLTDRLLAMLVLGLLAAGCGDSETAPLENGLPDPVGSTVLKGKVVGEDGAAVPEVQVVLHERTTHAKIQGVSGADGSFSLDLPAGVYDLGLDRNDGGQTATCFYGPVTPSPGRATFVLRSAQGLPADQVFGKLWLTPGLPAANRGVTLRPGVQHSGTTPLPGTETTTTAADGTFTLRLDSPEEVSFDLEVNDASESLDEWIDAGKRDKPCYVEFATEQSSVENRLRCNESELDDPVPAGSAQIRSQSGALGQATLPDTFEFSLDPLSGDGVLSGSRIPVNNTVYRIEDISDGYFVPPGDTGEILQNTSIKVGDNGMWWWKYAVNILPEKSPDGSSYWTFWDGDESYYTLSVFRYGNWHKVSYDSEYPEITQINLSTSL